METMAERTRRYRRLIRMLRTGKAQEIKEKMTDPKLDPCTCGHPRSEHQSLGGACLRCDCGRYTWTPPKKEEKEKKDDGR